MNGNGSNVRSLLASLVTGDTQFEREQSPLNSKNLLLREVYRLFETAIKLEYVNADSAKVESFIDSCFQ